MNPEVVEILEEYVQLYNRPGFIEDDPIGIPHQYDSPANIEIAGWIAATFAWGLRKTIINKSRDFLMRMGDDPHDFIVNHQPKDRLAFSDFKHRTFQAIDAYAFLTFLQQHYRQHPSLETAFSTHMKPDDTDVKNALIGFRNYFSSIPGCPKRTLKHVSSPARNSSCKRLNMFLRWMVRKDDRGVDFGIWTKIRSSQLCIPLDLHVERVARELNILSRKSLDWKAVEEITVYLKQIDPKDPIKYDFALFGMSLNNKL